MARFLKDLQFRHRWLDERPAYTERVGYLARELLRIEHPERAGLLDRFDQVPIRRPEPQGQERGHEIGL